MEKEFGNNVRAARLSRNLSLQELADLSGVSQSMLSKIERNQKTPTIRIAYQIADALKLTVSELLGETKRFERAVVMRFAERQGFVDPVTQIRRELISPAFPAGSTEFIFNTYPAGASTGLMPPHRQGFKEYMAICRGKFRVILNQKQIFDLDEGDSIFFEANVEHEVINTTNQEGCYYSIIESHEAR